MAWHGRFLRLLLDIESPTDSFLKEGVSDLMTRVLHISEDMQIVASAIPFEENDL